MLVEPDSSVSWPDPRKSSKDFCDFIHGNIKVFYPINLLIDTKEFQRLRRIKQLGVCSYVYHSANNDRFGHSMGAYHLAYLFVTALQVIYGKTLGITSADVLCVCIAALYHDIGHGPFSHLFEEVFPGKSHEDIGSAIIDRVFANSCIREAFEVYLGTGDEWKRNIQFIKELVHPGKLFDKQGNWLLEGRSVEKSFLYEIVSNPLTGLDVDKFDYILRDSKTSGCLTAFGLVDVERIRNNIRIFRCDELNQKHRRLCYNRKIQESIRNVGESRQTLHSKLYRHKTVSIINKMMCDVITEAREFKVGNRMLEDVKDDLDCYITLDDSIISEIRRSCNDKFKKSRDILDQLEERHFPKFICSHKTSPAVVSRMKELHCNGEDQPKTVREWIESRMPSQAIVLERDINRGAQAENPLKKVYFYDPRDETKSPYKLTDEELSLNSPIYGAYHDFCVYAKVGSSDDEQLAIRAVFDEIEKEFIAAQQ